MAHTTQSRFRVRYSETDQMGMVYYANYLVWMEVGRSDFCRVIETELSRVGSRIIEFSYRTKNGETLLAEGRTLHAVVGQDYLFRVAKRIGRDRNPPATAAWLSSSSAFGDDICTQINGVPAATRPYM